MNAVPPQPGERLGRHRIVERMAEGGMGVVWRAHDESLGRVSKDPRFQAFVHRNLERERRQIGGT